jgi:hypothetical protein
MAGEKIFTTNISKKQSGDTGMAMVLILLISAWFLQDMNFVKMAIGVLLLTMIWPSVFKYVAIIWLGMSAVLGIFVSKIVLSLIFYLVVFPVGFLRKIMGKDPLQLKQFKKSASSVLITRNLTFTKQHMDKPY